VEKGIANGDRSLIDAIPEALAATQRICSSVNVASTRAGINMDAVLMMADVIKKAGNTHKRDGWPGVCQVMCLL